MQSIYNASIINNKNAIEQLNIGDNFDETEFLQVSKISSLSSPITVVPPPKGTDSLRSTQRNDEPFSQRSSAVVDDQLVNGCTINVSTEACFLGSLSRPSALCTSPTSLQNGLSEATSTPTKSQVLTYFTQARKFRIKRLMNGDIQVTDWGYFPLMDAWVDVSLCYKIWRLESYGRSVIRMTETLSWNRRTTPHSASTVLHDWNGDFFGVLLPNERPFTLLSAERRVVARLIPQKEVFSASIDNGTTEIKSIATDANKIESTKMLNDPSVDHCWICILESNGRHIARLENWQDVQFNKDVGFQLKLLTLCGLIRLIGRMGTKKDILFFGKYLLSCCNGEI